MAKICLLTTGQPSTNPRLVKEADALIEVGHEVHVICARWAHWADDLDETLLSSRAWSCAYVGGDPREDKIRYWWTRLRHGSARRLLGRMPSFSFMCRWAFGRVLPELEQGAKRSHADLYIAHNLGALPPAVAAARKYRAKLGFDAEDFSSGVGEDSATQALVESIEHRYLPQCHYITAGSPEIAEAYAEKYGIATPVPILNVFPLQERPPEFRRFVLYSPLTLYWFSQTIGATRGLEDVIKAMGRLPQCDIHLHLRGVWQKGYKARLIGLATSMGVSAEKIKDHTPCPSDKMVSLSAVYDVGLALEYSVCENRAICLTNKIFTYLLAGNAVIATTTKAQKSLMNGISDAGFCYEAGDIEALAAQLKHWHADRESLERARRQAWQYGTRRYNWDLEKEKFLNVVKTVLNDSVIKANGLNS